MDYQKKVNIYDIQYEVSTEKAIDKAMIQRDINKHLLNGADKIRNAVCNEIFKIVFHEGATQVEIDKYPEKTEENENLEAIILFTNKMCELYEDFAKDKESPSSFKELMVFLREEITNLITRDLREEIDEMFKITEKQGPRQKRFGEYSHDAYFLQFEENPLVEGSIYSDQELMQKLAVRLQTELELIAHILRDESDIRTVHQLAPVYFQRAKILLAYIDAMKDFQSILDAPRFFQAFLTVYLEYVLDATQCLEFRESEFVS